MYFMEMNEIIDYTKTNPQRLILARFPKGTGSDPKIIKSTSFSLVFGTKFIVLLICLT